jgi:predicted Zn-dependent protease
VKFLQPWKNDLSTIFTKHAPCTEPIPYTLGTFDTKFNISKSYFLSALVDAEAIWEKPFGKDLFTYTPINSAQDVLKINLIYDYRQEATSKLASLGIVVKNDKSSYNMLKSKFTALKTEYDTEKSVFDARVEVFNQKQQAYEEEVILWNKKDGAPQKEYDKLQTTRLELETESKELQVMQTHINDKADEINAFVVVLNRLITSLNLSVEKYNTTNVSRGESFEEGMYSSDGLNREIDIYEFSSRDKLVRVLAHELGHALNLDHVDDPKAIMYEFNQGNNMVLTNMDLTELKTKCGVK